MLILSNLLQETEIPWKSSSEPELGTAEPPLR